ncbi:MAG: nucleotidyltransferase family protein [Mariprofundaceae bacterium]|nr:nucleotidyltransferase family protein [Mariprofundaceae bacterium]
MASSNSIIQSSRQRLSQILMQNTMLDLEDYRNEQLMMRSMHEGVDGLILPMLERNETPDIHAEVREAYRLRLREKQANYLRNQHVCAQVFASLNEANIPVICMRGLAVSSRLYGESAHLRPQSDIDLLFHENQMMDAKQVLWDIGFRPDDVYRNIFVRGDRSLDLHDEPLGIERIQAWKFLTPLRAPDFFSSAMQGELAGEAALLIATKVELPYLCFHAMKHSFERLIWLYDIALLASKIDVDESWQEVLLGIQEYALQRPCFYALSYVQKHLNAPVPEHVLDAIRPSMGFVEKRLFNRFMQHEIIPFLAERLFARMMPDFKHRLEFWRETIYPSLEVREQMANGGCVKCSFIRTRLKQVFKASVGFMREGWLLLRG